MKQDIIENINPLQGHELSGLSDIVADYDVFIIDLWGVIYNGKKVFETAYDCLVRLKELKKTVYLITNSPKSRDQAMHSLKVLGLQRDLYDDLITAGQKALELFEMRVIEPEKPRPLRTYFIDYGKLCTWSDQAGLISVDEIQEAELILAIHMNEDLFIPDPYIPTFRKAIDRDLLFVCANPDKFIMEYDIKRSRVGILADLYRAMGGRVMEIGKPHPIMFEDVLTHNPDKKTLLIGDSLVTDITAAQHIGVDSLLIEKGYHHEEFFSVEEVRKGAVYETYGVAPTYVCEELFW